MENLAFPRLAIILAFAADNKPRFVFRFHSILLAFALASAGTGRAHELPSELVARMLAKAEGPSLRIAVRIPLRSIREVEFPEFGPGYLDIEALAPQLRGFSEQWIAPFVEIAEDGSPLPTPRTAATQLSLPNDKSFESFVRAVERLEAPLPANTENLVWDQVLLDVLLEYPIRSERSAFSLQLKLGHLADRVVTAFRFETPDGSVRAYQLAGPPERVPLDPSWFQAAWRFVRSGFAHILDGPDHLLFLFCLVVPLRRLRPLALIVTAFTAAHSVTLIAAALGLAPDALWFPPLIETLIAVSILYMALENIVGAARRRWLFALGFGLVHGFGFSFALSETLQFAGPHLLTSLLAFNVGVELGQLFVLLLLVPALAGLFRFVVAERIGMIIVSALAAHVAWHWTLERAEVLSLFWGDASAAPFALGAVAGLPLLGLASRQRARRQEPPQPPARNRFPRSRAQAGEPEPRRADLRGGPSADTIGSP